MSWTDESFLVRCVDNVLIVFRLRCAKHVHGNMVSRYQRVKLRTRELTHGVSSMLLRQRLHLLQNRVFELPPTATLSTYLLAPQTRAKILDVCVRKPVKVHLFMLFAVLVR